MERKAILRREFLMGAGLTVAVVGCKRVKEKLPVASVAASPSLAPTLTPKLSAIEIVSRTPELDSKSLKLW